MVAEKDRLGQTLVMRYRYSNRDVFYGGGVVNGARTITLHSDVAERMMAKLFGNMGKCLAIKKIRLYDPVFAGDYVEFHAKVTGVDGDRTIIEVRSFKLAIIPENAPHESSIDILEDPTIVVQTIFEYIPRA